MFTAPPMDLIVHFNRTIREAITVVSFKDEVKLRTLDPTTQNITLIETKQMHRPAIKTFPVIEKTVYVVKTDSVSMSLGRFVSCFDETAI